MELFVNINFDATKCLIQSLANNSLESLEDIYAGDFLDFDITLADGNGNYAEITGSSALKLTLGIGVVKDRNLFTSTDLSYSNNTYSGELDFGASSVLQAIGTSASLSLYMELQSSFYDGRSETLMQMPFLLVQQLIRA